MERNKIGNGNKEVVWDREQVLKGWLGKDLLGRAIWAWLWKG
jgi:hypothetical protein